MGGFFVWRQVRRCRRARKRDDGSAILNLQGFRDHTSFRDEVPGTTSSVRAASSSFHDNEEEEQREKRFSVEEHLHDVVIN
jgi:hypothetical protein